MRQMVLQENTS